MCQTIYPQNLFVPIRCTDENIQDCLLLNCAFIISDITQSIVSQFMQNFKKTTFSVFLSFILVELSKFLSLKLNVSRMTLADFEILISFCRILGSLSNEINFLALQLSFT